MANYEDGDYILLHWDRGPPEYHAFKGHLQEEAVEAVLHRELEFSKDFRREDYGPIEHRYARWGWMNTDGWGWPDGEPVHELYFSETKGRGMFPVTVVNLKT